MNLTKIKKVIFNLSLNPRDLNKFRGAVNEIAGNQFISFHRHGISNREYSTLQYKILERKFGMLAIGNSIPVLEAFLKLYPGEITVDNIHYPYAYVYKVIEEWHEFGPARKWKSYKIPNWQPFSEDELENDERLMDLVYENKVNTRQINEILVSNLANQADALGFDIGSYKIEANITHFNQRDSKVKRGGRFFNFEIEFDCNLNLIPDLGIGSNVSVGGGSVMLIG